MDNVILKIFDYIFPPHVEALLVRDITQDAVRAQYRLRFVDGVYSLSTYKHEDIRALIHEAKFRRNKKACMLLQALFVKYIEQNTGTFDMIIPIPLSRARMRARGFNQVCEILRGGNNAIHIPIETHALHRVRDTRPQTELVRAERLLNMHNAFGVVHGERIVNKHILLVDDVTTTGATLKTAKATLLPYSPASITLLAFAH